MELFLAFAFTAVLFTLFGMWLYRYMLKKDPERLESLAQKIKDLNKDE